MSLIKICAYEITSFDPVLPITLSCCDPCFTPVGPGNQCNVCCYNAKVDLKTDSAHPAFFHDAQFEYAYLDNHHSGKDEVDHKCGCSCTFLDFCSIIGESACITLPAGRPTLCPCGCGEPKGELFCHLQPSEHYYHAHLCNRTDNDLAQKLPTCVILRLSAWKPFLAAIIKLNITLND